MGWGCSWQGWLLHSPAFPTSIPRILLLLPSPGPTCSQALAALQPQTQRTALPDPIPLPHTSPCGGGLASCPSCCLSLPGCGRQAAQIGDFMALGVCVWGGTSVSSGAQPRLQRRLVSLTPCPHGSGGGLAAVKAGHHLTSFVPADLQHQRTSP
jgi:hypothetical protein